MKNILFISFLFLSISAMGQKQSISLQAGLQMSYFIGEFGPSTSLKLGPAGGINYDFQTQENLLFGVGLHYNPRGFRYHFVLTDENGAMLGNKTSTFNYNYLSIPIRIGIVKGSKVKTIPYIALVPSVLTSANHKSSEFNSPNGEPFSQKLKEPYSDFDIGLMVGMEIVFPLSDGIDLFPSVSFYQGLSNFYDTYDAAPLRHWGAFVGLGFKYNFVASEQQNDKG